MDHNENELLKLAENFKQIEKNIAFAGVVALTRTAKIVQADIREDMDHKFILRNKYSAGGIRIVPATKNTLQAEVYSKDWYMQQQEEGAKRKVPQSTGGKFIIVGDDFYETTGRDSRKVIPKGLKYPDILKKKFYGNRVFEGKLKSGAGFIGVRRGKRSYPFSILYLTVKNPVNIRHRDFFFDPAEKSYDENFEAEYDKAYEEYVFKGLKLT